MWLVLASRLGVRGLGFRILWIELGLGFTVYSLGFRVRITVRVRVTIGVRV